MVIGKSVLWSETGINFPSTLSVMVVTAHSSMLILIYSVIELAAYVGITAVMLIALG